MLQRMPYFTKNKDWYRDVGDDYEAIYELTDLGKSIPEVVKSFEQYQEDEKHYDPDPVWTYNTMKEAEEYLRNKLKQQGLTKEEIEIKVKNWLNGVEDN